MKIFDIFNGLLKNIIKINDSNITNKQKVTQINKAIDKTYNVVKNGSNKEFEKEFDNIIRNFRNDLNKKRDNRIYGQNAQHTLGRRLSNREIEKQKAIRKALKDMQRVKKKEQSKIIDKKIERKTYKNRLDTNKNRLKTTVKKTLKKDDLPTLKKKFFQEYRRVKNIIKNERHRIKETAKEFLVREILNDNGVKTTDVWQCSFSNSRDAHIRMHGQIKGNDGFFEIDGHKTKYPSGFGIAKLDINCHCKVIYKIL